MNQLHGEWQAVSAIMSGTEQQPAEYQDLELMIEGTSYEVFNKKKSFDAGSISLQLGGKMEVRSGSSPASLKALYKVTRDTLTICYDVSGKEWPTALESKAGSTHYLVTYKKQLNPDRMKKVILIYGIIAGAIVAAMMFITMPMYKSGALNLDNGEYIGYTTMVIAMSMIFFGIKSYRDNYLNGIITFGKGVKMGLLIALIASLMYALAWEVCYSVFYPDFTQKIIEHYIEKEKASGATEEEMKKTMEEWASFAEMYKNPVIRFGMTLMEILPVGIAITLLSAVLLRRKEFLAT